MTTFSLLTPRCACIYGLSSCHSLNGGENILVYQEIDAIDRQTKCRCLRRKLEFNEPYLE